MGLGEPDNAKVWHELRRILDQDVLVLLFGMIVRVLHLHLNKKLLLCVKLALL